MKVACNNNYYLYAKSDYKPIKLHPAPPPCQVEEQAQQEVHPGKGRVRFNIPSEESRERESISILPFGGNKRNKVSERWKRKLAIRKDAKAIRAKMRQQEQTAMKTGHSWCEPQDSETEATSSVDTFDEDSLNAITVPTSSFETFEEEIDYFNCLQEKELEEATQVRDKEHRQVVDYDDISIEQLCQLREQILDPDESSQISDFQSWDNDELSQLWGNPTAEREKVNDEIKKGVLNGTIPSAVYDSGATAHAGMPDSPFIPTGKKSDKIFQVPTGDIIEATEIMELDLNVREPAKRVDIVPGVTTNNLLSTGKFADAGYITVFDEDEVNIYDAQDTIVTVTRGAVLRGWRDHASGLWRVPIVKNYKDLKIQDYKNLNTDTVLCKKPPTTFLQNRPHLSEAINNVYELRSTKEKIRYYHAASGFPTKATWLRAIKNSHYVSWPGLTANAVNKHFPESEETQKGHMRKQKKGIRSTKIRVDAETREPVQGSPPREKKKDVMVKIYDLQEDFADLIYTDQTGRFPTRSSRGNQYIMVLAEIDSDSILVEPMKNRTAGEMVKTYQCLIDRLKDCGITPKHHVLDNECSAEFKQAIRANNMTYELTSADDHSRNIAEKAIKTFKDHFIAIMWGTDDVFLMHLWDRLLPQAEMTLNMFRPSRLVPAISAHAHLHGQHDYAYQPLAPMGCVVELRVTPNKRGGMGSSFHPRFLRWNI